MQTLTIALLKEKGLEYLNKGLLGAVGDYGCVYENEAGYRCVAGATFDHATMTAIRVRGSMSAGIGALESSGVIEFEDYRTELIYRFSQSIHDCWVGKTPISENSKIDDPYIDPKERELLEALTGNAPTQDDLKAWLELIQ